MRPAKWTVWEPFLLAVMMVVGIVIGMKIYNQIPPSKLMEKTSDNQTALSSIKDAIHYVESRYIEPLNEQAVNDTLLKALVSQLDPHSYYLSGWDFHSFKHHMAGSYNGIGIDYEILNDSLIILHVLPGSPARNAGLQSGDIVLTVDCIRVSGADMTSNQAYQIWRTTGKELDLQVKRLSGEPFEVHLQKAAVDIPNIDAAFMIDSVTGFIKISSFTDKTYREFMRELDSLVTAGSRNLIIDVRDNPGGSFESVVEILNQLVREKDKLLVYMEGQHVRRTEFKSKGNAYFTFDEIAVLINQYSVSGSEILAGVLQDLNKGIVIGRRSYGKALVQETFPLTDSSALNLTIGKYYLPSGRFIQRPFTDRDSYEMEWRSRHASGEFFYADSLPEGVPHSPFKDEEGNPLPGGVGIVPDVFVPADSLYFSEQWKVAKAIVEKFALKQYARYASDIPEDVEGIMQYKDRSGINEDLLKHLINQPSVQRLFVNKNLQELQNLLWSEWIEFKLGKEALYRFLAGTDYDIQAAMSYIRNSSKRGGL